MKYIKPTLSEEKIELNFFLTNIEYIDHFTIVGNAYAQTSGSGGSTGTSGSASSIGAGGDAGNADGGSGGDSGCD